MTQCMKELDRQSKFDPQNPHKKLEVVVHTRIEKRNENDQYKGDNKKMEPSQCELAKERWY